MADLANAVIAYNAGFEAGDQLTLLTFGFPPSRLGSAQASLALHSAWRRFYGQQTTDAVTGIPRARIYGFKVMLNRRTKQEQRPSSLGLCLARRRKREA